MYRLATCPRIVNARPAGSDWISSNRGPSEPTFQAVGNKRQRSDGDLLLVCMKNGFESGVGCSYCSSLEVTSMESDHVPLMLVRCSAQARESRSRLPTLEGRATGKGFKFWKLGLKQHRQGVARNTVL